MAPPAPPTPDPLPPITRNAMGALALDVAPCTAKVAPGEVVPMPTRPPLVTRKLVAVDEPIAKAGPERPSACIESIAHGEVVPTPICPLAVNVVVPVAPKAACEAVSY